jgi:hypothetical protein
MAIKTFTDLTTLPASDINTYLANAGLVFVKEVSIGASPITSVQVSNAFSAEYQNYLVTISGVFPSTSGNFFTLKWRLADTTGFYGNIYGINYLGTVVNVTTTNLGRCLVGQTNAAAGSPSLSFNIFSPFLATRTAIHGMGTGTSGWNIHGHEDTRTTSENGFFIEVSGGTMTGGFVRVYGYRQA